MVREGRTAGPELPPGETPPGRLWRAYSEDMGAGTNYDGIAIVNPFV